MRRFTFRLDPVIRVRSHELEGARRELAKGLAVLQAHERALVSAKSQVARAGARLVDRARSGISAGEFALADRAIVAGYRVVDASERELRQAEERVARLRGRVAEAHTRLRGLELMRERALAEHEARERRQVQEELDEIAGRLHRRSDGGAQLMRDREEC